MHPWIPRDLVFPAICLGLLAGLGVALPLIERSIVMPRIGPLLEDGALTDAQATAIDHITTLGTLMINWCVAILGGIAVSARTLLAPGGVKQWLSGGAIALSFVACIVSIWLGMVVADLLIQLLTMEQVPTQNETLLLCRRWQYLSFVVALVFFVFAWINTTAGKLAAGAAREGD
jgi:hypothetical protein